MKNIQFTRGTLALLILLIFQQSYCDAQSGVSKEPMVNARITAAGGLKITPSKTSSQNDFDFLVGKWVMSNKRLKTRLNNCTEWIPFTATGDYARILDGIGNMDIYKSSFNPVNKKPFEGITLRLYNPETKLWSLYWADSNFGKMDPPVVGSFEGKIGKFYCKDTFNGKPILVMFKWVKTDSNNYLWSQAFSPDNGVTWETNSTSVAHRVK